MRTADYGEQLVERFARYLTRQFGRGFGKRPLADAGISTVLGQIKTFLQTASGKFALRSLSAQGPPLPNVSALAARFPLPRSAYVRLLSVRIEKPGNFTSLRPCGRLTYRHTYRSGLDGTGAPVGCSRS